MGQVTKLRLSGYLVLLSVLSLRVYYWYFKIPQCKYMEHGLKMISVMFKNIWHLGQSVIILLWFAISHQEHPYLWNGSIFRWQIGKTSKSQSHIEYFIHNTFYLCCEMSEWFSRQRLTLKETTFLGGRSLNYCLEFVVLSVHMIHFHDFSQGLTTP